MMRNYTKDILRTSISYRDYFIEIYSLLDPDEYGLVEIYDKDDWGKGKNKIKEFYYPYKKSNLY